MPSKSATRKRSANQRKRRRLPKKIRRRVNHPTLGRKRRADPVRRKRKQRFIRIFTGGKTLHVQVTRKTAVYVGGYLSSVGRFLETNDRALLKPYDGKSIRDVRGNAYVLETRPNALYRLNAAVEPFEEIYRLVA